jgi:hypothetical protein
MALLDIIAFLFGLCMMAKGGALFLKTAMMRDIFSKTILRLPRFVFTLIALITAAVALYLIYLIVAAVGFGAFAASAFASCLLLMAYAIYWSDTWKTVMQQVLKHTTGWIKLNAAVGVIVGLIIMILAASRF